MLAAPEAHREYGWLFSERSRVPVFVLMSAWSAFLLFLFTQHNDFPAAWNFDEPTKVAQIISGKENFTHPQLMLRATDAALWLVGGISPQQIVVAGRWVSAIAAVGAVDLLTLLAISFAGRLAGCLTAIMVGTNPLLFGLAHYMKEDPVYVLCIASFLVSLARYEAEPTESRLALLGLTAGLTASGKYLGVFAIPLMFVLILWKSSGCQEAAIVKLCTRALAYAAAVFLLINIAMLGDFSHARWAFELGVIDVTTSHGGLFRPITSAFYAEGLVRLCTPLVLGAYVWWLVMLTKSGRQSSATFVIVSLLPIGYLALLQLTPVKIIRYELPPVMIMTTLAACCLARLASDPPWLSMRVGAITAVAAVLVFNVGSIAQSRAAMVSDTRAEMAHWISEHLDRNAVLLEDRMAGLVQRSNFVGPELGSVPVRVITVNNVPPHFTLEAERSAGITHILVADLTFGRLFNRTFETDLTDTKAEAEIDMARAFYRELFETGTLLHHIEGATPTGTYFSPGLWLFSIEPKPRISAQAEPPSFDLLQD